MKMITSNALSNRISERKYNDTPTSISSNPNDVALVVACILLNDSLNLNRPMDAISIKTEPRNINMMAISVIFFV